jgi:hypothetical protein
MINDFMVKAFPEKNQLKISLDGYFMRSELELALHLAKRESKKLRKGFDILIDIQNMKSPVNAMDISFSKLKRILGVLGGGRMMFAGINFALEHETHQNVGLYPNENEWFLS